MDNITSINHLNTAAELLKSGQASKYKYAALELRFCIETITYKKLDFYSKLLPSSVKKIWQPGKFFSALMRLEPKATKDFSLSISREKTPGVAVKPTHFLGEHKTFDVKWLSKNYQKLSKILHARAIEDEFDIESYLKEVIDILKPIVNSSLDCTLEQRISLPCDKCGSNIPINLEIIGKIKEYECLEKKCGCINFLIKEEGKLKLQQNGFEFPCKCKKNIYLRSGELKVGDRFRCENCGQLFMIDAFKATAVDEKK